MTTTSIPCNNYFTRALNFAQEYIKSDGMRIMAACVAATAAAGFALIKEFPEAIPSTFGKLCFALATPVVVFGIGKIGVKLSRKMDAIAKNMPKALNASQIASTIGSSRNKPNSMLFFRTTYDYNDVYISQAEVSRVKELAKSHSIELLTGSDKSEINQNMEQIKTQYDKIVIKAHANPEWLRLAEGLVLTKNSKKTMGWFRDHVKPGGAIILEACSAAKGVDNIAREISFACPEAYVYGSDSDIEHISGLTYDQDCIPTFYDYVPPKNENEDLDDYLIRTANYKRDSTRVYKNGELLQPAG